MKKYKVSVYMKSGNVIYIKCEDCVIYRTDDGKSIEKIKYINPNAKDWVLVGSEVECVIAKKWWQKWG